MCGFVGYINNGNKNKKIINKMNDSIKHRGPDDGNIYVDDYISLGFRRLSIIDLKEGMQPIFNEDKNLVLLFNGEIYNYQDLRKDLIEKKHKFKTNTDSEVLIHGYEEYGEKLLNKLRGMFAFIIYDKNKKEIFGARDYFGIKPFYYYKKDNEFIFGSEIKSFLHHPNFKKEFNPEALEEYLTFEYSVLNETFFKNVFKLLPAHYFKYKNGNMDIKRYWNPNYNADESKNLEYWAKKVSETMEDSIEAHKISDVEVGSFLSSGIDSSYLVTLSNVSKTFTVGFKESGNYNEISYAKELSHNLGIENISKIINAQEYFKIQEKFQYHMDEPIADPAAVALYFLSELASKYVKVALSGEGSDELFLGYNIYKEPYEISLYNKIPFVIRKFIGKICSILPKVAGINFLIRRGKRLEERYIGNVSIFDECERKKILNIKTNAKDSKDILKPYFDEVKDMEDAYKMQNVDLNNWLVGDILQKADKMSMANSLEVRVPYLDIKVMNLASKIPVKYKLANNTTKYVLRTSALEVLPEKWSKKRKLGFPVPIRVWLKEEKYFNLVKKNFESDIAKRFFNEKRLMKLLNEHYKGKKDNSRKIWTIYSFIIWYKVYFESDNRVVDF